MADDETVDISEAVDMGAAVIYDAQHQHDSFRRGRKWATAVEGVPGILEKDYEHDVARARWYAETAIVAAWDWLRDYFYSEFEADDEGEGGDA